MQRIDWEPLRKSERGKADEISVFGLVLTRSLTRMRYHIVLPESLNSFGCKRRSAGAWPSKIQQIIVVVPATFSPADDDLLLLFVLGDRVQNILQLSLCDLLSQLAAPRQHNETILDISGSALFDQANASKSVCCFGIEDLGEDVLACFGWTVALL